MAIDTETRRRFILRNLPVPDSSITQADRQHILWVYPGILSSVVQAITAEAIAINMFIEQSLSISLFVDKSRSINSFIDKRRDITIER